MKTKYEKPEMTVDSIEITDIITVSETVVPETEEWETPFIPTH